MISQYSSMPSTHTHAVGHRDPQASSFSSSVSGMLEYSSQLDIPNRVMQSGIPSITFAIEILYNQESIKSDQINQ